METATQSVAPAFERVAAAAADRLVADRQLRRALPGGGILHLDRGLPFLVAYRQPSDSADEGTRELATALSAYLVASGEERFHEGLHTVVEALSRASLARRGAFLLVELWSRPDAPAGEGEKRGPSATVVAGARTPPETAHALVDAIAGLRLTPANKGDLGVQSRFARAELRRSLDEGPPGLKPLLPPDGGGRTFHLGVEVSPFYRDAVTGTAFPRVVQALRKALADALERALFVFSQAETSLDPAHPRALGRTHAERAALDVDRRLGEVYGTFDTLFQVTPVNTDEAWEVFRERRFERKPELSYRPLPFDPEHLKRRLFHVPIERVEDPLLGYLFREKQEELDRQITMLRDLETPRFFHASAELHGTPDDSLVALATKILGRVAPPGRASEDEEYPEPEEVAAEGGRFVDAAGFAAAAAHEIERYRGLAPQFDATVEIRPDVAAGLMVSKGILCVDEALHLPRRRVQALLSHEVGTHLVTYCNGAAQPLRIFASGLAGYDPLQEGLAVLAEHLVGGFTPGRARVLAGRVLAVRSLVDGGDFVDTFRMLHRDHGFEAHTAFIIALRVHRGGGLTKDAAYLDGLRSLLQHLRGGGQLEVLLVGKLGLSHADVVQELVLRGVLRVPLVKPLYMADPVAMARLERCRGMDVLDLVESARA